jgi:nicotinate phosphoribosyltransferase
VEKEFHVPGFGKLVIVASNDINEETLDALNKQGHEIDAFGIGTHLVTCFSQPALGGVYKLVEIKGQPRIKLSEDVTKVCIYDLKTLHFIFYFLFFYYHFELGGSHYYWTNFFL